MKFICSLPVVWFSLLDDGSNKKRIYSLKNITIIGDAILDENDNSIVTNGVHTTRSNSKALVAILSQCAFQSNRLSTRQKKESLMGAAITVAVDTAPWRSFECRKRTASLENSSVEVQSKHFTQGNTCITSSKHNRVSIPPKRFRIRLSDDGNCHSSQ